MKLAISKEQIINGLQAVQSVVSTRTTLAVLSNVLLRAEGNHLELTATDLDVTISSRVEANVIRAGVTTLPVKKLFGLVRELPAQEIEIEVDEKNVALIQSGPSFYKINGLSAEEFPPITQFGEERKVKLPQEKVRSMLRKTSFAISNDEARYVLNGIFFSLKEHKISMVATDGRRLAMVEEEVDVPTESQSQFIVPSKAINELNRLLVANGEMEIRFNANQVAFTLQGEKGASILLISKLIDGNYPNYRQVIPAETKERITLLREEFLQALRRADLMTSEKSNSIKLNFGKNSLSITANSPDVGEARESLAMNYNGNEFSMAFNPAYMMDPLKALENDEIFLEFTDELSPTIVRVNEPFIYVIMPMRTN